MDPAILSGETSIRVRYGEVDRMNVVHHPHFLDYFECGRTELLRAAGLSYREIEDAGTLLMVAETGVKYLRPAHYDDVLTIRTALMAVRRVQLRFAYEVVRDGEVLATGHTVLAAADESGRLRRLPAALLDRLEGFEPAARVGGDATSKGQEV